MKKFFRSFGIFVLGILVGAIGYMQLAARIIPVYLDDSFRAMYTATEHLKAFEAEANGDSLRAIVHYWNAADASGVHWYRGSDWMHPDVFTFSFLAMNRHLFSWDSRAKDRNEAQRRGDLALIFERNGFAERAEREWRLVAKLMMRDDLPNVKQEIQSWHDTKLRRMQSKSEAEGFWSLIEPKWVRSHDLPLRRYFSSAASFEDYDQREYDGNATVRSEGRMIERNKKEVAIHIEDRAGRSLLSEQISFEAAAIYIDSEWSPPKLLTLRLLDRGTAQNATLYSEEDGPRMLATLQYRYNAEKKIFERVQ